MCSRHRPENGADSAPPSHPPRDGSYKICSVCSKLVPTDPRGDVLDAAGRCDQCAP